MKNKKFFGQVSEIIKEKSILNHPFYKCWQAGLLKQKELQDYMIQYYHLESVFPRLMSSIHANCEDGSMRTEMLKDLINEEWAENNHVEHLITFAEALGLSREELLRSEPNKNTKEAIDTLLTVTKDKDITRGLAAIAAYKEQIQKVAITKEEGLKKFYGIESDKALKFFRVHAGTNRIWHSLLDKITDEKNQETSLHSVRTLCDAWWHYLDGVTTSAMSKRMAY
jgi:pyrroloquinoline-quinone synthase